MECVGIAGCILLAMVAVGLLLGGATSDWFQRAAKVQQGVEVALGG